MSELDHPLCPRMETQIAKVLHAFERAANKHWGVPNPESKSALMPAPVFVSGKRTLARVHLRDHPEATDAEVMVATGVSQRVVRRARDDLGLRQPQGYVGEKKQRVLASLEANNGLSDAEIAKATGASPDYVKKVRRGAR